MSVTVSKLSLGCVSFIVLRPMRNRPSSISIKVFGFTNLPSSAAATVKGFNVDPGSN